MLTTNDYQYILWDPKDGNPPRDASTGAFLTDGVIGAVALSNVYLTTYGIPKHGGRLVDRLATLGMVGGVVRDVEYRLSGSKGVYDVYRVR